MTMEKFKIYKAHKMLDWLENECTEWAYRLVTDHFEVDSPDTLSREQIDEVVEQWEEMLEFPGGEWLALGLRNVINSWENEHEEYII